MPPRMFRAAPMFLLVACVGLAGCVDGERDGDDAETEPPAAVVDQRVVLSYDMTGTCDVSELWLDADDPDRFLPPGFHAVSDGAPFVVRTETCGTQATGAAAGLLVRIEEPPVAERVRANLTAIMQWTACDRPPYEHRYFVAGYSDARFWIERYRQAGIPTVGASVSQSLDALAPTPAGAYALAQGRAAAGDDVLFAFDAVVREGLPPDPAWPYAVWSNWCAFTYFQSDHGLLVIQEMAPSRSPMTGPATCEVAADQPFGWAIGPTSCAHAAALVLPALQRDAYAVWFHETFVTPGGAA